MTGRDRGYIVVIFGGAVEGWCDLSHCPMEAFGPFETSEQAKALTDRLPEWQQPHALMLSAPKAAITVSPPSGVAPH